MRIFGILLAAGGSRRMGRDKLALSYKGSPVLARSTAAMAGARRLRGGCVVTSPLRTIPPTEAPALRRVVNPHPERGMAISLRCGVAAAPASAEAYAVILADLPELTSALVDHLARRFEEVDADILVPVCAGRRGHPVFLSARFRDELLGLEGDAGARELIRRHPEQLHLEPVDHRGTTWDLDRPEDLRIRRLVFSQPEDRRVAARALEQKGIPFVPLGGAPARWSLGVWPFDLEAARACCPRVRLAPPARSPEE